MINRAIKELVIDVAGEPAWVSVVDRTGLGTYEFADVGLYDDDVTVRLVESAAIELDRCPEQILEDFGRHWVLFTGHEGWGPLLDMAGNDVRSFVGALDSLHARVQVAMPHSRMPSFTLRSSDADRLEIEYRSTRTGLAPMVLGLLGGVIERFGESWQVRHAGCADDRGGELFVLDRFDDTPRDAGEPTVAEVAG